MSLLNGTATIYLQWATRCLSNEWRVKASLNQMAEASSAYLDKVDLLLTAIRQEDWESDDVFFINAESTVGSANVRSAVYGVTIGALAAYVTGTSSSLESISLSKGAFDNWGALKTWGSSQRDNLIDSIRTSVGAANVTLAAMTTGFAEDRAAALTNFYQRIRNTGIELTGYALSFCESVASMIANSTNLDFASTFLKFVHSDDSSEFGDGIITTSMFQEYTGVNPHVLLYSMCSEKLGNAIGQLPELPVKILSVIPVILGVVLAGGAYLVEFLGKCSTWVISNTSRLFAGDVCASTDASNPEDHSFQIGMKRVNITTQINSIIKGGNSAAARFKEILMSKPNTPFTLPLPGATWYFASNTSGSVINLYVKRHLYGADYARSFYLNVANDTADYIVDNMVCEKLPLLDFAGWADFRGYDTANYHNMAAAMSLYWTEKVASLGVLIGAGRDNFPASVTADFTRDWSAFFIKENWSNPSLGSINNANFIQHLDYIGTPTNLIVGLLCQAAVNAYNGGVPYYTFDEKRELIGRYTVPTDEDNLSAWKALGAVTITVAAAVGAAIAAAYAMKVWKKLVVASLNAQGALKSAIENQSASQDQLYSLYKKSNLLSKITGIGMSVVGTLGQFTAGSIAEGFSDNATYASDSALRDNQVINDLSDLSSDVNESSSAIKGDLDALSGELSNVTEVVEASAEANNNLTTLVSNLLT